GSGQGAGREGRSRSGDGQVLRDRGRAGERARLHAHPRWLWLLAGVSPRAVLPGRAAAPDRRRVERDPAADHRPAPAGTHVVDFSLPPELDEIRAAVRELCAGFPGEYWRGLEPDRYPEEFVRALTE